MTSATDAGTYNASATPNENYEWSTGSNVMSSMPITWVINKKEVTIKANDQTINYGSSIAGNAVTATGLITGHFVAEVTLAQSTTEVTTTGTITVSNAVIKSGTLDVTDNYNITYLPGNLTINKKPMTNVTAELESATYIYDGNPKEPNVTVRDNGVLLEKGMDYTLQYTNNSYGHILAAVNR